MSENKPNPHISIAAIIGGLSVGIVAIFAVYAPSSIESSAWIVGALCLMGTVLGYLSNKQSS